MTTIENIITLFKNWYEQELKNTQVQIPTAVCLSTVGIDNFPNARFVSLKEIINNEFVITGPLNSRKGLEFKHNNNVALTFWWTATERQVRIQGIASQLSETLAEKYFEERSANSKAVSLICEQGQEVQDLELLEKKVQEVVSENKKIDKPKDWSGLSIKPIRIEFMEFKKTRFHNRKLYELENEQWHMKQIQP
ncbi:pyridoxine/pyridoxamine 5'-phosphate oxidase [Winogradskyella tangerina]|uniref:pyridoxine/pyridoxamine 5'-phosphate oxidase n=1 Tax=Winogradskyella tangerina TaxID=2023240 RepID=UPI000DBE5173|nr:pyridoxal 5'-phosphate synthase [Winogradskyella tangerina]